MIRFRLGGWLAERQNKQASREFSTWLLFICFVILYSPLSRSQQSVAETDISKYQGKVSGAKTYPAAEQGTIASYIGIEETWHYINVCESQDACPDVFLFDKPVHNHHNLGFDVVGHHSSSPTTENAGKSMFLSHSNEDDKQHGTAMAGIIGARRGDTGVIGVNPTAHIFSVDWDYYRSDKQKRLDLVNILGRQINPKHLPIFVFATDWESDSGLPLNACNQRQNGEILGNFIVNTTTPLIIAAAGDPPKGGTGLDIGRNYRMAPPNLGDCENVIVVTACLDCRSDAPKIASSANYSTSGFVHLAAYGDPVLSTGFDDHLTIVTGGTSPAAAFVAGVASAMVSKWPKTYKLAPLVKFRLQVSSTPTFTGADALKVNAGVLNAELAFKDPDLDYLSTVADVTKKDQATHVQGWCVDQIEISKDGGPSSEIIPVSDIFRIYCSQIDRCTIYHADSIQRLTGVILRSGPGELIGHVLVTVGGPPENVTNRQTQVLFKADNKLFTPLDFTDLILHDVPVRLTPDPCTPADKGSNVK